MHSRKPPTPLRRLFAIAAALGLLATACSDAPSSSDAASSDPTDTETTASSLDTGAAESTDSDATDVEAATSLDSVTEDDLARFVAATESAVVDTSVEGVVLDGPESYIAIAQASCARLTQGDTLKQIVNDYLDTTTVRSADDEQLIGAVLGAAVETICPEHQARL